MGLVNGGKLLTSLKSHVIFLASSYGVPSTIQSAAQYTLQASWSILLPTANERAQTLSSLLPNGKVVTFNLSTPHVLLYRFRTWFCQFWSTIYD